MATGFDKRDTGRSSFAFEPARASQSQPVSGSGFRGIQSQGGNTSIAAGVAAAAGAGTMAGPEADRIGGFLSDLLAPAIERRKKEQFVKGMVDQMSAVSGEEIRVNSKNPLNTIFGPSSYEEGAVFYSAKDAVNKWQTNMLGDMDNLKRLPPEELTKVVAKSFESMLTGDRFTDLAVETSLIEASAPVVGAIAKERYKWQQAEAAQSFSNAAGSSVEAFQSMATSLATNSDPSDAGNLAMNSAVNNFRTSLMKPEGMDEETYKKSLTGLYRQAAQGGHGYAVTAMEQSGFLDILTDEEFVRLEDVKLKYANRALGRAALNYGEELDKLNSDIEFGRVSAVEAMATAASINEKIKGDTGFDVDLFDYKEITGAGKSVWSSLHQELIRQEGYRQQTQNIILKDKLDREAKAEEAAETAAQVKAAYGAGRIKTATAAGIGSGGNYDVLAQADFAAGNWTNMARAYRNEGWTSSLVKDQIQVQISAGMGKEYSKDFEQAYTRWAGLNKASPAMAGEYYGDMNNAMLRYDMLVRGGTSKNVAFQQAFSDISQYAPRTEVSKTASDAIETWVSGNRSDTWGGGTIGGLLGGKRNLNESSANALRNVMGRQLTVMMANSDVPADKMVPGLYERIIKSGAFEDYGKVGWANKPGTTPLGQMMGLQQDEADEVVQNVIDKRLKASGFSDGVSTDNMHIYRIRGEDGKPALTVQPETEDGPGPLVVIPFDALKSEADTMRAGRVPAAQQRRNKAGQYNNVDPYRRVKGETGAQRIARINREVAAGADPVKH